MTKYFVCGDCTISNHYMVRVNFDAFEHIYTKGSYNVLGARVMGLDYATYLRMCRDKFGATLHGKNCLYVYPTFEKKSDAEKLALCLNERLNKILELVKEEENDKN